MDSENQEMIVIDQRPENWGTIPENSQGEPYLYYYCDPPGSPDTMVSFSVKNGDLQLKGRISSNYIYNQLQNAFHLTKDYIKTFLLERNEIPEGISLQNSIENISLPAPRNIGTFDNLYSIIDRLARRSGRIAGLEVLESVLGGGGENDLIRAVENYTLQQQQEISKPINKDELNKFKRFIVTKEFLQKQNQIENAKLKKEEERGGESEKTSYQKVISEYRENKNISLICSMCQDTIKEGELAIALPCKNIKTGESTPHYFHAYNEKDPEVCIGGNSVEQWLLENNTCPCCRYEFPEDTEKLEEKKKKVESNTSVDLSEYIQNYMNERRRQLSQPCQCDRCQEARRRRNMSESERMEDDMIQEAIRRSTMNNSNDVNEENHENINEISSEVEDLERAIQMSLFEQANTNTTEEIQGEEENTKEEIVNYSDSDNMEESE